MSIFGFNSVTESTGVNHGCIYQGAEGEGTIICHEAACEISELYSSLHVADVMMESKVVYEGANAEVLLEGVVKDTWERLKEIMNKFFAKLKSWFAAVRKALESFFMPIVKLVKKYEDEIVSKDVSKFEYEGYKWKIDAFKKMKDAIKLEESADFDISAIEKCFGKDGDNIKVDSNTIKSKKEELLSAIGAKAGVSAKCKNVSDLKEKIVKGFRPDSKSTIKGCSVLSVSDMISIINEHKDSLRVLDEAKKDIDEAARDTISSIDDVKGNLEGDKKANHTTACVKYTEVVRYTQTLKVGMVDVFIKMTKELNSEASSVLRSLVRYKPANESFGTFGSNSSSLLEAASNMI